MLHRTFGALIEGEGLVSQSDTSLKSAEPAKSIHVAVYPLTAQTETADAWLPQLETNATRIGALSAMNGAPPTAPGGRSSGREATSESPRIDERTKQVVDNINRGYRLQRFVNACGGRGSFPYQVQRIDLHHRGERQGQKGSGKRGQVIILATIAFFSRFIARSPPAIRWPISFASRLT